MESWYLRAKVQTNETNVIPLLPHISDVVSATMKSPTIPHASQETRTNVKAIYH